MDLIVTKCFCPRCGMLMEYSYSSNDDYYHASCHMCGWDMQSIYADTSPEADVDGYIREEKGGYGMIYNPNKGYIRKLSADEQIEDTGYFYETFVKMGRLKRLVLTRRALSDGSRFEDYRLVQDYDGKWYLEIEDLEKKIENLEIVCHTKAHYNRLMTVDPLYKGIYDAVGSFWKHLIPSDPEGRVEETRAIVRFIDEYRSSYMTKKTMEKIVNSDEKPFVLTDNDEDSETVLNDELKEYKGAFEFSNRYEIDVMLMG